MQLGRLDYLQVGGTNKGALSLLPGSRQNLVIIDNKGEIKCIDLSSNLRTLWSHSLRGASRLELGTSRNSILPNDTLYVSSGSSIYSYKYDGTETNYLETNIAESIRSFKVQDSHIWTTAKFLYGHFENGKETHFMILNEDLHDITIAPVSGDLVINAVLACQDKTLKVIEDDTIKYFQPLSCPPLVVDSYILNSADTYRPRQVIWGGNTGSIGVVDLTRDEPIPLWTLDGEGSISTIAMIDMNGDGRNEIVVGRDDWVEVYNIDQETHEITPVTKVQANEGIMSMTVGKPRGVPEVVISTFSGKVVGFADENTIGSFSGVSSLETMESEISALKGKLEKAKSSFNAQAPSATNFSIPGFIQHKFILQGDEAIYTLTVDSQIPIGILCIKCDVDIEYQENKDMPGVLNSIKEDSSLHLIFRFSDTSTNHIQVKLRPTEGQGGLLTCYAISALDPKFAQQFTSEIKPLSLHEKVSAINESAHPVNVLKITGNFSKGEIHGWVSLTLPDVPPHSQEEIVSLYYTNCVLRTALIVNFSSSWAEFKSESISTITIIKENISQQAAVRKIHLDITCTENPDANSYVLSLLNTQLGSLYDLDSKIQLIDAMKEIEIQGELEKFSSEFQEILKKGEEYREAYKKHPKKLQYLQGVITDLYVDTARLNGIHNIGAKIPQLQHLLANYDLSNLIEFFKNK
jgi:Bardet-Biedl syndrome 7 protein